MTPRSFYVTQEAIKADSIYITGMDAHHIHSVLRLVAGTQIICKDYARNKYVAELTYVEQKKCQARICSVEKVSEELSSKVHCLLSMPRPQVLSSIIPKLTELGVESLHILLTERSFISSTEKINMKRYEKVVIESLKQCGRNVPMRLPAPILIKEVGNIEGLKVGSKFVAWEGGATNEMVLSQEMVGHDIYLFIGPEGGFIHQEIDFLIENDFIPVSLGPFILKVETAIVSASSLLLWQVRQWREAEGQK